MKRIVICGAGASGKDHLKKNLINTGYRPSVSYTTRPPREGEVNGQAYHFVTEQQFHQLNSEGKFLETDCFRGWYYATGLDEFLGSEVFIMTVAGVKAIPVQERASTVLIYLDIDKQIRRQRLEARQDADSVDRRLNADEVDFNGFVEWVNLLEKKFGTVIRITNPDF
jgi:guanylate kinase